MDPGIPFLNRCDRLFGQGLDRHEPLLGQGRLDHGMAPVAMAHPVLVVFHLFQQSLLLKGRYHLFPAGEPFQAGVGASRLVHHPVIVHHLEGGQAVTATDFKIVDIVGRGHLEGAGAKLPLHMGIKNNGDLPVGQGQAHRLFRQGVVAFVRGMHRHRGIAEHGLGPGSGHHQITVTNGIGIADMVELAGGGFVLHLQIGQGGTAAGTPVDDVVSPVDEPLVIEPGKYLAHRPGEPLVHGEPFPLPVAGAAQPFELVDDLAAGLFLPLPDPFDEFAPTEVLTADLFPGQLPLHHVLGGNAGMVGSRQPEGIEPVHPFIADQDVLQGIVQGMAHMKDPGDIGRRDDDGKGLLAFIHGAPEMFLPVPVLVPLLFNGLKFIGLGKLGLWLRGRLAIG